MNTSMGWRLCFALLASTLSNHHAFAAGVVTAATESNLRAALAGGGNVTFAVSGTITLTGTLVITNNTTIDAAGQSLGISGSNVVRVFQIQSGVTLKLQNLTVQNGFAAGTNGAAAVSGGLGLGGAFLVSGGVLDATGCFFQSNQVYGGTGGAAGIFQVGGAGGIGAGGVLYNVGGQVFFTGCTFQGNQAFGGDGGDGVSPNAFAAGNGGSGWAGVLYSFGGQAFLTNCIFVGNSSQGGKGGPGTGSGSAYGGNAGGGAVVASNAVVQLVGCEFRQNQCVGGRGRRGSGTATWESGVAQGGGLQFINGNFFASGCRFSNNVVQLIGGSNPAEGGAIWGSGVAGRISDSIFQDNAALGGGGLGYGSPTGQPGGRASGGGVYLGAGGTLAITNTTFDHNSTLGGGQMSGQNPGAGAGGGIYNLGGLTMTNCTFYRNIAQAGDNGTTPFQGGAFGGSIYNRDGTVTLENLTIASGAAITSPTNSGAQPIARGGGIYSTNGSVSLHSTLIAYSSAGSNCFGTITDWGHNLSSDASSGFSAVGSLNNTDPKLGPLDFYGGSTPTMPLLTGSPAIDGGDSVTFPPTDQRGHARPYGAAADIGAFESSSPYVVVGRFIGYDPGDTAYITLDGVGTNVVSGNSFRYDNLAAGSHFMTASNGLRVVTPATRNLALVADVFDANFTTCQAVNITATPQSQSVFAGSNVTLSVTADGGSLTYQWRFYGTNLPGATGSTLTLTNFQVAKVGSYVVVVSNLVSVATSAPPATLTFATLPSFVLQPQTQTSFVGNTIRFISYVNGSGTLTYQWRKSSTPLIDGVRVSGSTSSNLTIANLALSDAGNYSLFVTNVYGSATSSVASLTVLLGFGQTLGSALPWVASGNVPWFTQTNTTHDGIAAAQSGSITGLQSSAISAVVTGPGTVTFWWKVSSEQGVDYLRFLISGTTKVKISGEVDWQQKSFAVPAGTQLLQWTYSKDLDVDDGLDKGWLGEVRFENNLLDYATSTTNNGFQFRLDGLSPANYVVLASSNLTTWIPISTNLVSSNSQAIFIDATSSNFPIRLYRAQQQ